MGIAISPISGGLLLEHFDWSSHFLVEHPDRRSALITGAILIPESSDRGRRKLDFTGAGSRSRVLTAIVWGLIEASGGGWTNSNRSSRLSRSARPSSPRSSPGSALPTHPMLDVSVFRSRRFRLASISIAIVFFA